MALAFPILRRAAPTLLLAAAPVCFMLGDMVAAAQGRESSAANFLAVVLPAAAVSILATHYFRRLSGWAAGAVAVGGLSADWVSFLMTSSNRVGLAVLEVGAWMVWLACAALILTSAFVPVRWPRWILKALLFGGGILCALWLGHDLLFVYGPLR
jgi:hypothetical protein